MNAGAIAAALGGARRGGRKWRCRCPLHGGHSLEVSDGQSAVLVTCWAGCSRLEVLAELRRRGLIARRADYMPQIVIPRRHQGVSQSAYALTIWQQSLRSAGSPAENYLDGRGIAWPSLLRFHPRCPRPRDGAGNILPPLPAMVALVEHVDRVPVSVHCTYLRSDGSGKADTEKPKAIFGPVAGGAVRFGTPHVGQWPAVAEGIETALSVAMACSMPAWAASGIKNLLLPPEATHVVICADHDASGAPRCG